MISEKTAKKLETDIEWNGRANVCVHCGRVPETFYVATGHDHTDDEIRWCICRDKDELSKLRARVLEHVNLAAAKAIARAKGEQ